ncbi:hypothetical protein FWH30_02570 [Microgenomates group bacterium]|nr:hypothetical protein [Microgenomates group bacterium]
MNTKKLTLILFIAAVSLVIIIQLIISSQEPSSPESQPEPPPSSAADYVIPDYIPIPNDQPLTPEEMAIYEKYREALAAEIAKDMLAVDAPSSGDFAPDTDHFLSRQGQIVNLSELDLNLSATQLDLLATTLLEQLAAQMSLDRMIVNAIPATLASAGQQHTFQIIVSPIDLGIKDRFFTAVFVLTSAGQLTNIRLQ